MLFDAPEEIIVAREASEVDEAFARMRPPPVAACISPLRRYELGYALEGKFAAQHTPSSPTPLLLFGPLRIRALRFGADEAETASL